MPNYDFHTLSPYDFELISRDIIQARDNIVLESFRTGRDGGIDFRYCPSEDQKIIVQCKHYRGTSVSGLIRSLKKEAQKLIKLSPSRYIIVTSLPLTPANKASIQKLFASNVLKAEDVITAEDLNNLLGMFPQIETSHHKLWLASIPVMQKVLHNAEHTRAVFEIERISEKIKRYVQSDAYSKAIEILNKENFVIIAGQPGVGKTTLAEMLVYAYAKENFRPVVINSNIEEARRLYTPGERQVFYYDDFLGATFLGEQNVFLGANHDRDLLKFIDMVRRSTTAKLILTTREHILSQALRLSERLFMDNIVESKCVIEVSSYTRLQKAHMLYNHIYFSELPEEYIEFLLNDKFYMHIIDHTKFNPRIIEWLSTFRRIKNIRPKDFTEFVRKLLEDPAEIWLHAYKQQLSESARTMLLAIHSLGSHSSIDDIFQAFEALSRYRAHKYNLPIKADDRAVAMSELCDSFVISKNGAISYINPSVADLMNRVIREIPDNGFDIIYSAQKFRQITTVCAIAQAGDGEALRAHLSRSVGAITPILRRLSENPVYEKRDRKFLSVDVEIDMRAICLLDIAEFCRTSEILELLGLILEKTLERLQNEFLSVRSGLGVYKKLLESSFAERSLIGDFITRFKMTMLAALKEKPTIDDLCAAVLHTKTDDDWKNDMQRLRNATQSYIKHNFYEEFEVCTDANDFGDLHDGLERIRSFFDLDLSHELQRIVEKIEEIEKKEEDFSQSFGRLRPSQTYFAPATADDVASMFETLTFTPDKA
jgi:DNA polymerase III delta prime subunit